MTDTWAPVPEWPHEASSTSAIRTAAGRVLKAKDSNSPETGPPFYQLITLCKPRPGGGPSVKQTFTVHRLVLLAHRGPCCDELARLIKDTGRLGPCPAGHETRHLNDIPDDNRLENLAWGTKVQNEGDKDEPSVPPGPSYPCRNARNGCPNLVMNEGRRCLDCVTRVGIEAAKMRRAGMDWPAIAEHFGNSPDWVRKLAVRHGGYEGEPAGAPRLVTVKDLHDASRSLPAPLHELCRCPACRAPDRRPWWRRVTARLTGGSDPE